MERVQHNIKIKLLDIPRLQMGEQELHRCLARRADLQRAGGLTALERPYFTELSLPTSGVAREEM